MRKCRINAIHCRDLGRAVIGLAGMCLAMLAGIARAGEGSPAYEYYLNEGIQAFKAHDDRSALDYFNRAHLLEPSSEEPLEYINLLKRVYDGRLQDFSGRPVDADRAMVISDTLDRCVKNRPVAVPASSSAAALAPAGAAAPKEVPAKFRKMMPVTGVKSAPDVITIDDILAANQAKPAIRIDVGSSVIIEGRAIQRFLQVNPDFFLVKAENNSVK